MNKTVEIKLGRGNVLLGALGDVLTVRVTDKFYPVGSEVANSKSDYFVKEEHQIKLGSEDVIKMYSMTAQIVEATYENEQASSDKGIIKTVNGTTYLFSFCGDVRKSAESLLRILSCIIGNLCDSKYVN